MNFVEELKWRGILHDIMPGTEELLKKETVSAYIGFDPTADSLHVGSLAQIMTLLRFQNIFSNLSSHMYRQEQIFFTLNY